MLRLHHPARETDAVTAAKYELSNPETNPVGRLVYGKSYLARSDAMEIDPVELRLGAKIEPTTKFNGLYGAIRDASPDYRGRLIIERAKRVAKLDEMDYLLELSDARAGALSFGHNNTPPAPNRAFNTVIDLEELQEVALEVIEDKGKMTNAKAEQARRLLLVGTAMGGARPKAVVEDAEGLWIAKFNRPDDRWDSAKVEHMMLQLARACGIAAAHSRVTTIGHRNVLLVKRFDREKVEAGYLRARMVSALTLLRSEDLMEARGRGDWSISVSSRRCCLCVIRCQARCARAVPSHVLQRGGVQSRRSCAQSRCDRDGSELEARTGLRSDADTRRRHGAVPADDRRRPGNTRQR